MENWSVKDALTVLDEIDKRISVIEAIRKLSSDKTADELHVLHPLIASARWIFGPEFDSPEYSYNNQLQTPYYSFRLVSVLLSIQYVRRCFFLHH